MPKTASASQGLDTWKQHKYVWNDCRQSGCFSSSFWSSQTDFDCIPLKMNINPQRPFLDFQEPYPVHPMTSHKLGN